LYENWELCICDDASEPYVWDLLRTLKDEDDRVKLVRLPTNSGVTKASNQALALATGEFVALLDHDDMLTRDALFEMVRSINRDPNVDILYSDEDKITKGDKHYDAFFKPDWSPELLRSIPYMGHMMVIRKSLLEEVGGFDERYNLSPDYYLQLMATAKANGIVHIPRILYSWRAISTSVSNPKNRKKFEALCKENLHELEDFARRMNLGSVEVWLHPNTFRVRYPLTETPLVTVVIPTFDKIAQLRQCLSSIERSTYKNREIIIVTNNLDENSDMRAYLRTLPHKVIVFNAEFSWSEMNNLAARHAQGQYLLFLNDDTEVATGNWIENMLEYAQQPDIGAVGCRLLFPTGSCQHAGVTGDPVHVAYHQFYGIKGEGYYSLTVLPREVSAVTGACMMVRKEVFQKLGGFDSSLKYLYNDTDFCWRLGELGYRIMYDPSATLYHHEGASRYGRIDREAARHDTILMLRKWRHRLLSGDRFYNHGLVNARIDTYGFTRFFYPAPQSPTARKTILLFSHNLNFEGAPLVLLNMAKYLKSREYAPVVVSSHDGRLRHEYLQHDIPVIVIPDLGHLCSTKNDPLMTFMASFDLVIANTTLMYFVPKLVAEFPFAEKPKVMWVIHESPGSATLCQELGISYQVFASALQEADKVVFVSDASRQLFRELCNLDNSVVVHNAIDWNECEELLKSSEFHLDKASFNILSVGTIYSGKGQDVLIDAAIELLTKRNLNLKFYIVGKIGNIGFYDQLKRKVSERGLADKIIFTGELDREDVMSCYAECDVFVLPSRRESFPLSLLEAMAFGKPIIATGVFGVSEQIKHEVSGIIIESDDPTGLVDSILRIFHNSQLASSLGTHARDQFLEEFRLERMGNDYERLIEQLTALS
jgi:GT2 family glycosyltransferase